MDAPQSISRPSRDPTSADNHCPELSLKRRGYTHLGYKRFDNKLFEPASIGSASIGKVTVDCKFLFEKSLWGVLSKAKNPAGIIYLDLSFHQPPGHRLKDTTVTVSLDDENSYLNTQPVHRVPVQIGKHGPTHLIGTARRAMKINSTSLKPEIRNEFVTIAGVGTESETLYEQECYWTFSSELGPDPNSRQNSPACKVLQWHLAENHLEKQPSHSNTIHTAFSFQHDGQPFLMHVSIRGRLQKRMSNARYQIRNKFKNLEFGSNGSDSPSASTLIKFGEFCRSSKPLDEIAEGLCREMEQENMKSVPKEMPASHRTTSQETLVEDLATQATDYSASEQGTYDEDNLSRRNNYEWDGPTGSAATQTNDYATDGVSEDPNLTSDNECLPTTKNLTDILLTLEDPRYMRPRNTHLNSSGRVYDAQRARARRTQFMGVEKLAQECSGASTTTLVDEEPAATSIMTTPNQSAPDSSPKGAVLRILRLTGLINLLHLCMILINSWGLDIASQSPVVERRNRPMENDAAISSR